MYVCLEECIFALIDRQTKSKEDNDSSMREIDSVQHGWLPQSKI